MGKIFTPLPYCLMFVLISGYSENNWRAISLLVKYYILTNDSPPCALPSPFNDVLKTCRYFGRRFTCYVWCSLIWYIKCVTGNDCQEVGLILHCGDPSVQ